MESAVAWQHGRGRRPTQAATVTVPATTLARPSVPCWQRAAWVLTLLSGTHGLGCRSCRRVLAASSRGTIVRYRLRGAWLDHWRSAAVLTRN